MAVRVNPNFLPSQHLHNDQFDSEFWSERSDSIVDHERHLARQGTVILKFWLNVSKEEQKRRLISRIDRPEKNWKFDSSDMHARQKWPEYMQAYEDMLDKTSTGFAPWYAIPADDKPFMRLTVATIVANTLESLNLNYPTLTIEQQAALAGYRKQLAGLE